MKIKNHAPCPECGSSDGVSTNPRTGWDKCFVCNTNFPPEESDNENMILAKEAENKPFSPLATSFRAFPARGLSENTIRTYKVDVAGNPDSPYLAKYPQMDINNKHIGNKIRRPDKNFAYEGTTTNRGLFGRWAFPPGSAKYITVVEGQDDAMAAFQMTGSRYPCVSVDSAATALKDVKNDFEYLNSFENIIFAFDADEPGKKAAAACAAAGFPVGKVKILSLRKHKDSNDYLLAKDGEAYTREWWQAPVYRPDGLKLGTDIWQEIIERKEHFTCMYPFEGLNEKTFGIRLSELVVVTADTGVGKTSIIKHIEHKILTDEAVKENGYGVGFLHLEEPNGDTALGLLSVHNSVPYHIPTVERPEADLRKAYDELLNNDRVVIWDHFGSNSVDAVLDKVRHMVALGCRYIVLDHLSIVVSDQSGDERKQLDEIATKLKTLTMELDIAVIAIIHTNRQGQIRGTAGVEQLANIVIRLERNKTDANEWRRNITKVSVEKNRFCGYTGPAAYLWYNKDTARLMELPADQVDIFEKGGTINDDQLPWA